MTIEFVYMKELEAFLHILVLGFVLSLPVCYAVESLKSSGIKSAWFYFLGSIVISGVFGMAFAKTFTQMNTYEAVFLSVCLWLGSQGFYEKLKVSDGFIGKAFVSLSERFETNEEEKTEEKTETKVEKVEEVKEKDFLMFPVNYVGITTGYSSAHPAIDFGFSSSNGGKNQPIIAPSDMEIVAVGESEAIGKFIRAYATVNGEKYTYRFIHMSATYVSKGDKVSKGTTVGRMGNTGTECNGYHLHFDIWEGHTADLSGSSQRYAKSVNPLEVCYLTDGQAVGDVTDEKYKILKK